LGAKDSVPRKGTVSKKERDDALQAELGKVYKERDDYKRQVDDLRFQLNYGKAFNGDSKALLTATYKAEYYPSQEQLYAAKTLLDREYPHAEPGQYETDETGRVICYLPHNGRDPLHQSEEDSEEAANWYVKELQKRKRASIFDWDRFLHQLIDAGEISEPTALKIRARLTERRAPADERSDDVGIEVPEWEPAHKPAPDPVQRLLSNIEVVDRPEPEKSRPPAPNGHAPHQVQVRMLTSPRKVFTTRTGKRYEADLNGDVWIDECDRAEIAGFGATEWR
jgi:hypothetical protein